MYGKRIDKDGEIVVYKLNCESCSFFQKEITYNSIRAMELANSGVDLGTCRIRSTEKFPQRTSADWCGEHEYKQQNEPAEEERKTSEK